MIDMMNFSTDNLRTVFAEEGKYEQFRKLCFDLVRGHDIYEIDDNGIERKVSKAVANKGVRKVFLEILGLNEETAKSKKLRRRAIKKHAIEIYEIIEEDIEWKVREGYESNEWFNQFVEERIVAEGDDIEFVVEDKSVLIVADVSGNNHDITMQQLGEGETFQVATRSKGIKIGKDIDLIILGRYDYTRLIEKISEAFIQDVQAVTYDAIAKAATKLPSGSGLTKTGVLSSTTKQDFDDVIELVGALNASDVVIMGTKNALKKITAIADVSWASHGQKDAVASTGTIGIYEGTDLVEIPQRVKVGTTTMTFSNNRLYILPVVSEKFVKFVDAGETEIIEVTEKGYLVDDFQTYEIVREYGADVVLGQYFGRWTFVAE